MIFKGLKILFFVIKEPVKKLKNDSCLKFVTSHRLILTSKSTWFLKIGCILFLGTNSEELVKKTKTQRYELKQNPDFNWLLRKHDILKSKVPIYFLGPNGITAFMIRDCTHWHLGHSLLCSFITEWSVLSKEAPTFQILMVKAYVNQFLHSVSLFTVHNTSNVREKIHAAQQASVWCWENFVVESAEESTWI